MYTRFAQSLSRMMIVLALASGPLVALAQTSGPLPESTPLVPCGKSEVGTDGKTVIKNPCDLQDLIVLAQNLIRFMLFNVSIPLTTLAIAYAGFEMVLYGGDPGKYTEAKKILQGAVIGFLIAFSAYAVVNLILQTLVPPSQQERYNPLQAK